MISIVLSINNEEKTIRELTDRIDTVMRAYTNIPWEIVAVDDASKDESWHEIIKARERHPAVVPIRHSQRLGQKGCFMSGFKHAKGDIMVLMDADLQVLPEELPVVLDKMLVENFEWVCTYNTTLKGGKPRNVISGIGNVFMRLLFGTNVQDAGNNFVGFKKKHVRNLKLVANDQRYLLPIAMSRTLHVDKITEVAVRFDKRKFGKSKYSMLKKAISGIPEMFALKKRIKKGFYAS